MASGQKTLKTLALGRGPNSDVHVDCRSSGIILGVGGGEGGCGWKGDLFGLAGPP